jgi:hypothetical protein
MLVELWSGESVGVEKLRHMKIVKDSVSGRFFIVGARFYDVRCSRSLSKSDLLHITRELIREAAKSPSPDALALGEFDFSFFDVACFYGLILLASTVPARRALYDFVKMLDDNLPTYGRYDLSLYDSKPYGPPLGDFFIHDSLQQELGLFNE